MKHKKHARRDTGVSRLNAGAWMATHRQVAASTLRDLLHRPLGSAMTVLVIGIALALPAGLLQTLTQLQDIAGNWQQTTAVSIFLKQDVGDESALALATSLEDRAGILETSVLTRDDALVEFRQYSGFGDVLGGLEDNPLPTVLLVYPVDTAPEHLAGLARELEKLPEADLVQYDDLWLKRFRAITRIGHNGALVLGMALGLAVVLVTGNTIRLEIENRRAEIEITKLVGATDAFVRRPFLYRGLWFGLAGGLSAWLFVGVALTVLASPFAELSGLYGSQMRLSAWEIPGLGTLGAIGSLLGVAGAQLAVGRHLHAVAPA
ncbi:MAG: permease-like cell division protein FtsX [Pseudomonadota bacterium]